MVQNIDEISYSLIKKTLDASTERGRVIAHNIANVNTSGFKASKVVFEDKLNDILESKTVGLRVTNNKHINDGNTIDSLNPDVVRDKSTSMRADGNNVEIDNQMTELAANSILYNALINQANNRISSTRYVITGGGR